jgi:hypothetical protein
MTANLDIANRALQFFGSRTNMNASEFAGLTSNEAIQANLIMFKLRDELNRMAPWNCTRKYTNLVYISSQPGTPENSAAGPPLWVPGIPPPQWSYEYQYPSDCTRPRFIIPQYTSLAGGTPIYPLGTVTGFSPIGWTGPALKYEVSSDQFFPVTAANVATGGTGYLVGDTITLAQPSFTFTQAALGLPPQPLVSFTMPVGAPAVLTVTGIGGGGAVTSVTVVNQIFDEPAGTVVGGSYFSTQQPVPGTAQGSTSGSGTGATFTLTFGAQGSQRVIICNQEAAILCYNTRVTDPNVMDEFFQDAWVAVLAARLVFQLSGDKALANQAIGEANRLVAEARIADGNENLTVNDVTPDWLRTRGNFGGPNWEYTPNMSFDWGSFYSPY